MDTEAMKHEFDGLFQAAIASGMAPNEAVAHALMQLHQKSIENEPATAAMDQDMTSDNQHAPLPASTTSEPSILTLQMLQENVLPLPTLKKIVYEVFSQSDTLNEACFPNHSRLEIQQGLALILQESTLSTTMGNALSAWVTQPWTNCKKWTTPEALHQFFIVLEHPLLFDPDYRYIVGGMTKLMYYLNEEMKLHIKNYWKTFDPDDLHRLVDIFQQFITLALVGGELKMDMIFATCDMLQLLHDINNEAPFTPYTEFYNDAVNTELNLLRDYANSAIFMVHKHETASSRELSDLSFCDFPFVLDAASKSKILQYDAEYQQRVHVQDSIRSSFANGELQPYLILRVRRENVIQDALHQIVQVATSEQLKKPLKVKFIGEEGVDEGGVQKEFFQIIIRQLLDPNFGMFIADDETRTLWFNCDSYESTTEFELIGILLGLAIYNGVILELHFPSLVYKKLMGLSLTLDDLEEAQPALGKGLRQLLEFEGDVEAVFARSFELSYEVFGEIKTIELVPEGKVIPVTSANRGEYVAKYVEYVTTTSVAEQYGAFHRGFHFVCGGDALKLFRSEELELLICGSPELDFEALQEAARYDDGFTEDSPCVQFFWNVVHAFSLEEKKQLLKFCTGSDRAPIRGLSSMVFVISRNGSDSDRLPTAHTCFNHLLLPDYSSQEKMQERLKLAISQSEGFGLL
ncbi:HECT E3 ubiquitin ligase [Thraustotheca clavata]|uniref:HECT-type E3 ubiquitin transferase n=1 Tax=Thraustotheca clavata TaxID=74557 RepID=A0A1V9Z6D7_9STRA|nr:HECT E3 ubiquitin ligase [Thraustotheca clavata]